MSDLPKRVLIDEEGPREGFQSEKKMIPVADKVCLIEALAETGLTHIACVSYVNPRRVPTMAEMLDGLAKGWQEAYETAARAIHADGRVSVPTKPPVPSQAQAKSYYCRIFGC